MVPFSLRRDRPEPRKMPTVTSGRAEVWSSGAALPLQARGSRLRSGLRVFSFVFFFSSSSFR